MYPYRTFSLFLLFFLSAPFYGTTQEIPDSSLVIYYPNFSNMGDTVIVEFGNCSLSGDNFRKDSSTFSLSFARREWTVKNGKLKKEMIYDSNSGYRTVTHYGPWNMTRTRRKYVLATNAPHP